MQRFRTLIALSLALAACEPGPDAAPSVDEAAAPLTLTAARAGDTGEARPPSAGGGDATGEPSPPPAGGTDITGGGPGGLPTPDPGYDAPPPRPWLARPVVYAQYVPGGTSADYSAAWSLWRDHHHHPAVLNAHADLGPTRYTGVWHKNHDIVDWVSRRNMTEADYLAEWQARDAAGWRVLDLDAHETAGGPRFHAIWVEDAAPTGYRSHRSLSRPQLEDKIELYRQQGLRPTRINAWTVRGMTRYSAVWVDDGRTDFLAHVDLSGNDYAFLWGIYRDLGYAPVDIGPYRMDGTVRYSGIWLREDGLFDNWASVRNRTADQIAELDEDYAKANMILVDLDGYAGPGGEAYFSAIWQRPVSRRVISSNRPTAGDADIAAIRATADAYEIAGADGRRGTLGAFVIDLQTGDYVAYNMHEPFYLASTSKVLIGARVAAHPDIDPTETVNFASTMWRGEDSRGFTEADIDTDVAVSTFMANMIQGSDTASTDYLFGRLAAEDGALGLQDWLDGAAGLQNVGEITDICELDKRVSAGTDACVFDLSCDTWSAFHRSGDPAWNATDDEAACLAGLGNNHRSGENYEDYYTTRANTITPAEYGRFFWLLGRGDLMTDADRGELLAAMDAGWNDSFNIGQGTFYDEFGTKNGGKRRVSSQVGLMWDWDGVAGDHTNIRPRYAFALFTEDWSWQGSGDVAWARAAMRGVLDSALSFLEN